MKDTFNQVGYLRFGYAPKEVDKFFAKAHEAYSTVYTPEVAPEFKADLVDENAVRGLDFKWVRNGYNATQVDAALDRLVVAFIQRRRAWVMAHEGEKAWLEQTYAQATSLYPRMMCAEGERFTSATGSGYRKEDVDNLINRVAAYFDGKVDLTAKDVRWAAFRSAKGANAYAEKVVDVYLDRVAAVLIAVE